MSNDGSIHCMDGPCQTAGKSTTILRGLELRYIPYSLELTRKLFYTRSPYVIGCCLRNNLDAETQKLESKLAFKMKIKSLYRLQQNPDT